MTVCNTFGWMGHVAWSEVGHFNLKTFNKQFRAALPIGMPKSDVEAYLTREGIPFSYSDSMVRFSIRAPYDVRTLKIDIKMDSESKVSDVNLSIFMYK